MERPWLGIWPEGVPTTIDYPEVSVPDRLRAVSKKYPNKVAIVFKGVELTYLELDTLSDKLATGLYDMGIRTGDRVGLFLQNSLQFVISFFGVLKAGAIIVPCNPQFKERELKFQLNDSGAETIITTEGLYPLVKKIRGETGLARVIVTSLRESTPPFLTSMRDIEESVKRRETIDFVNIIAKYDANPPRLDINPKEDVAILCYSGGTTGIPKGCMLTHYNLIVNQLQHATWRGLKEGEEVSLIFLPMYHIFGLSECMCSAVSFAWKIVLLERFRADEVINAINEYRPTLFFAVPTVYIALLNHPNIEKCDFSSFRLFHTAASAMPTEIRNKWIKLTGPNLMEGWGLTEASPGLVLTPIGSQKPQFVGIPLPDTDVKVVDMELRTRTLPPGENGELTAKGPQIMKGYWNQSEMTKETLRDGWLHTGDIGYMDEEGRVYFVDRKKDVIKVSGYQVWPFEVENVLSEHPAVEQVAVIGVPDQYRGEHPKAFVILREGYEGNVTEEELIKFCRERMAAYKIIREVEFRKDLPKSPAGKILRRTLRKEILTGSNETH
ncbi:MAG: long-chain fatty acid--CoA ligase [Promethearchaeota archaeon]